MRGRRGVRAFLLDPGFTLLEVLLAISILAVFASMALPRLAGAYAQLRWHSQKRAIATFVRHAERLARVENATLVIDWEREARTLSIARADDDEPGGSPRSRIDPADFLELAGLGSLADRGQFGGAGIRSAAALTNTSAAPSTRRTPRLRIADELDLDPVGLPVRVAPNGATTEAALRLVAPPSREAVFEIDRVAAQSHWVDEQ